MGYVSRKVSGVAIRSGHADGNNVKKKAIDLLIMQ